MVPLSVTSSDDEKGPVELPSGELVCGPHGYVVCGICCSDYSYMELSSEVEKKEKTTIVTGDPV